MEGKAGGAVVETGLTIAAKAAALMAVRLTAFLIQLVLCFDGVIAILAESST